MVYDKVPILIGMSLETSARSLVYFELFLKSFEPKKIDTGDEAFQFVTVDHFLTVHQL